MEAKFYLCPTCGNIICKIVDSGVTPVCCGKPMELLAAKSEDVGVEKHLPVITRLDSCTIQVKVGSAPHPSTAEHHIVFIALHKKDCLGIKTLAVDGKNPEITFRCQKGEAIGVYSYCNIHGLWYQKVDV